jgi:HPr kinase/phosphorylase
MDIPGARVCLHASCVAVDGKGCLIKGRSGSGKSSLALALMALGAELVSDDRTNVSLVEGWAVAEAPEALFGMIEARGVGLLRAAARKSVRLALVVDLDETETERLPIDRSLDFGPCRLPCFHKVESVHFAASLRQYLVGGKVLT